MEDKKTKLKIEKEDLIEENVDYVFTIKGVTVDFTISQVPNLTRIQ